MRAASTGTSAARRMLERGIVRNFVSLLGAEGITRLLGVVTFVVVVRSVGPASIGHLVFAQAILSYVSVLGDGGLTTYMQRQIASRTGSIAEQVTAATTVQAGIGGVLAAVLVAGALLLPIESDRSRLLIVLAPALLVQGLSLAYVLQALEDMVPVALVRIAIQVVVSAISLPGVVLTGDIAWMAVATWAGLAVGNLFVWVALRRRHRFRLARFPASMLVSLVRNGMPFLGIAIVTALLLNVDIIVLGMSRPPDEVGEYGAAFRLVFLLFSVSGILATVALPQLVSRFAHDRKRYTVLLETLVRLVARTAFPVVALLAVEATTIVPALLGADFEASAPLVAVLAGWLPLGFYNTAVGVGLIAAGLHHRYLQAVAVAGAVSIGLLIGLVPTLGAPAAAWILLVRETVILLLFTTIAVRARLASPAPQLLRQLHMIVVPASSLVLLALLWPDRPPLASLVTWAGATLALEGMAGWPVLRELGAIARPASRMLGP